MTPATPPRSRSTRYSRDYEGIGSFLATPRRHIVEGGPNGGLITPGTVSGKPIMMVSGAQASDLKFQEDIRSPVRCFKSPEYTPRHGQGSRRRSIAHDTDLASTSRILFPMELTEGLIPSARLGRNPIGSCQQSVPNLLPPKSAGVFSSGVEEESGDSESDEVKESGTRELEQESCSYPVHTRKYAKQVPGTPTDKVITFQLAKDWNNNSAYMSSEEDDGHEDVNIKKVEIPNIFLTNEVTSVEVRKHRREQLLKENPNLDKSVTLVNKKGVVVGSRQLTPEEIEICKPKMLFEKELEEQRKATSVDK
ncbi:HDL560Cp [Eremothecium sinecaudum]|uniref:HDL560Cp n=1 Tax=Eremothecium sinecaudum TaxID=45286 RepID=A0A0X8HRN2_9SACH|nr:HDL560Cp [Eremothecium sinecaudum]AMD20184.1 HDL560Cp [Eremothecium sinecaudum]